MNKQNGPADQLDSNNVGAADPVQVACILFSARENEQRDVGGPSG